MIGALRGQLRRKDTDVLIVDVGGVGYRVSVPLSTYYSLPEAGGEVDLRIYTHVRDVAIELYGFGSQSEQALFEALIGVSGIGPKLAVTILSGMEADTLVRAIANADIPRLTSIPGVGKKTAERVALELKDRATKIVPTAPVGPAGTREDVLSALLNLGYKRRDAEAALGQVGDEADSFEDVLRLSLRELAR
ncbi:MAG: Holliday junction branch migration protein RuvA [Acidobacteria bacterium]|nr:Holliday junction branch migration protein RuvA [Acidobacteriota bacterium]